MATEDRIVSIHPYFKVPAGNFTLFKQLCERFVAATTKETKCLYYGFSFHDDEVHCREAYEGAEGLLTHLDNVASLLAEALTMSELNRLEIHGAAEEVEKLKQPLAHLNVTYFTLEYGIRR